jgi:hypothetical protein
VLAAVLAATTLARLAAPAQAANAATLHAYPGGAVRLVARPPRGPAARVGSAPRSPTWWSSLARAPAPAAAGRACAGTR